MRPEEIQNDCSVVVDALPYIDQGYDESMRAAALALIEDECQRFSPFKKYVPDLSKEALEAFLTPSLRLEFERMESGKPMETLSMKRYELPGPSTTKQGDVKSWYEAVQNTRAQLEHQELRMLNLSLMAEYGPEVWREHAERLNQMTAELTRRLNAVRQETHDINVLRKSKQIEVGSELKQLEARWVAMVTKNYEIEKLCADLTVEIQEARKQLQIESS